MRFILLFCLLSIGCVTATGPNGEKYASVGTNYNIKTAVKDTSDTNIIPLPGLGGKVKGQDELNPEEGTQEWAMIIGGEDGIKVGMQDQGTPLGILGKWSYKMFRVDRIYKGLTEIAGGMFKNRDNKTAAEVTRNADKLKAGTRAAEIKAETDQLRIATEAVE